MPLDDFLESLLVLLVLLFTLLLLQSDFLHLFLVFFRGSLPLGEGSGRHQVHEVFVFNKLAVLVNHSTSDYCGVLVMLMVNYAHDIESLPVFDHFLILLPLLVGFRWLLLLGVRGLEGTKH